MEAKPYKIPHPFRKLNKNLIDIVVKDIDEGSTYKLAAESNGITKRILEVWRLQGEIDIEHEQDSLCAYLVRSLAKAKKKEVKNCRKSILNSDKGHKGAEWTLEHAYARDFCGNVAMIELSDDVERLLKESHGEKNGNIKDEHAKQITEE